MTRTAALFTFLRQQQFHGEMPPAGVPDLPDLAGLGR